jgi:TolA-binding protein
LWDEEAVFSRTVRATEGQLVEIPFRGTGWVYLGEIASRRGIVYESRRLDPEGQSFIFHAEAAGAYALQFYKQDFIREFILNDYVQVLVGEAPASAGSGWFNPPVDQGRVIAQPRWPASLDEARRGRRTDPDANTDAVQAGADAQADSGTARRETAAPASGRAVNAAEIAAGRAAPPGGIQTPPGVMRAPDTSPPPESPALASNAAAPVPRTMPPDFSPENFLQKAGEEFEAGKVASAIALLDQFRERYPAGSDEAYWLYGQFYEANSPSRDILAALDYYRRLVREYPQSGRYNDARRRIAYLERYYINIQ